MPASQRIKTHFPGVYYIEKVEKKSGKTDRVFYVRYRKNRKQYEEKVGSKLLDTMTAARAAAIRQEKTGKNQIAEKSAGHHKTHVPEIQDNKWTINLLWQKYSAKQQNKRSFASDVSRYSKFIKITFGNRVLASLTPGEIKKFRNNLLKTKSPQTVKHILALLNRLHNFSIRNNLGPGLSFAIEMPKVENKKTEVLKPEQLSALLQAIDNSEFSIAAAMMKIALFTGMRRSEMFRLEWNDIDFDRGCILIRSSDSQGQTIPLNNSASNVFAGLPRTSNYVFPGHDGKQLNTVTREVNAIKKAAGLPNDFRPLQGLRHTYASLLASSGKVDMYTLQQLLNHKSPQMTQRYAHLREEELVKNAEVTGEILEKALLKENRKPDKKPQQQGLPLDINQYDITKKTIRKTKQKKTEKGEKKTITKVKQLKIPGLG